MDALAEPRARILSVDVFDTLLCRRVPKPTDAHLVLGRTLADKGLLKGHLTPRLFARLRVLAENEARAHKSEQAGTVEVSLEEICAGLAPSVTDRLSAEQLAALELDNEASLTFPDPEVVSHLRQISNDLRLIAVSDTYFSADQLRSIFRHHHIDDLGWSAIYTSSDWGAGKGGGLWERVVADVGDDAQAMVHAGDNPEADVVLAARAGVVGVHLPMSTDRFAALLERERIVGDLGDPSPWCDERLGDGGITAARRRASLLTPPISQPSPDEQVTWETGTAVLGPVFAGFSQWVHERAAAAGSDRALCVMREGQFLQRLLRGAPGVAGHHLALDTVRASREGCARASIYEGSEAELRTFLGRLNTPNGRQVATSLGLDPAEVPEIARLLSDLDRSGADDRTSGDAIVDLVLSDEGLLQGVVERSEVRRRRLIAHLVAAAGAGEGPVMVVDVGWGGTILETLQRMVDEEGEELSLHGLYLLAHIGSAGPLLRGSPLEGYLGDSGCVPFDLAGITGNPELVELVCMCDDGTFLEMGEDGDPVLAETWATAVQSDRRALLQEAILTFQSAWSSQRTPSAHFEALPAGKALLRRVLERFLSLPDREEIDAFGWWSHEENFGSHNVDRVVPTALRPTLHLRTAESLHLAPPNQLYWVGGAAGLVDPETADAVWLMRRGAIGPGRLNAGPDIGSAGILQMQPDGSEAVLAEVPLACNRRGACFVEWSGSAEGALDVRIRPSEHPAIVRLDWFEMVIHDRSGAPIGRSAWTPPDGAEGLLVHGATLLGPDIYAVDARTRVGSAAPPAAEAHSVTVSMGAYFLSVPRAPEGSESLVGVREQLAAARREIAELHATKLFRAAAAPRRLYGRMLGHRDRRRPR